MKVKELKEKLKSFPDEMDIVVDGYEEGFADSVEVYQLYLLRNKHGTKDGIYGKHDAVSWDKDPRKPTPLADMCACYIGYRVRGGYYD